MLLDLLESFEELQAVVFTKSIEEGRNLLTSNGPASLAAELQLEAMSQEDVSALILYFLFYYHLIGLYNTCMSFV